MQQENRLLWTIWDQGQSDPEYARMLVQLRTLESQYKTALEQLDFEQQEVIRGFVSQCEAMSWRMLEIACAQLGKGK